MAVKRQDENSRQDHGGHFPRWINGHEQRETCRAGDGKDRENQAHAERS
jgi:hypothetical protein